MSRFNTYFNSNFSGCRLVATGYDPHREREVNMYLIPGEAEVVGVSDKTDRWVAPLTSPFLEPLTKAIRDLHAGNNPTFPVILQPRPGQQPEKRGRKALIDPEPALVSPRARKPLLVDPGESQPRPRTRITLN